MYVYIRVSPPNDVAVIQSNFRFLNARLRWRRALRSHRRAAANIACVLAPTPPRGLALDKHWYVACARCFVSLLAHFLLLHQQQLEIWNRYHTRIRGYRLWRSCQDWTFNWFVLFFAFRRYFFMLTQNKWTQIYDNYAEVEVSIRKLNDRVRLIRAEQDYQRVSVNKEEDCGETID